MICAARYTRSSETKVDVRVESFTEPGGGGVYHYREIGTIESRVGKIELMGDDRNAGEADACWSHPKATPHPADGVYDNISSPNELSIRWISPADNTAGCRCLGILIGRQCIEKFKKGRRARGGRGGQRSAGTCEFGTP